MSRQILTLELDGTTAGDYLTWCRDPDPPALALTLRSIRIQAEPLGDTITAILDWTQPAPAPAVAAQAAGLPLMAGIRIHAAATTEPARGYRMRDALPAHAAAEKRRLPSNRQRARMRPRGRSTPRASKP